MYPSPSGANFGIDLWPSIIRLWQKNFGIFPYNYFGITYVLFLHTPQYTLKWLMVNEHDVSIQGQYIIHIFNVSVLSKNPRTCTKWLICQNIKIDLFWINGRKLLCWRVPCKIPTPGGVKSSILPQGQMREGCKIRRFPHPVGRVFFVKSM